MGMGLAVLGPQSDGLLRLPFAKTFTDTRAELLLLRSLRKKIVFIYLGSDARPPYIDRITHVSESAPDLLSLRKRTRRQSRRIRTQERFATHCINLPGTGHFHRRPFVNWFELGLPRTVAGSGVRSEPRPGRAVRILHSPSDRRVKGTDAIAAGVESLRSKGYELDLVTVTDAPNSVVNHELSACDLVVDQLTATPRWLPSPQKRHTSPNQFWSGDTRLAMLSTW